LDITTPWILWDACVKYRKPCLSNSMPLFHLILSDYSNCKFYRYKLPVTISDESGTLDAIAFFCRWRLGRAKCLSYLAKHESWCPGPCDSTRHGNWQNQTILHRDEFNYINFFIKYILKKASMLNHLMFLMHSQIHR
jgi:hypothetical protein